MGEEEPLLLEELLNDNPEESKCQQTLAKALLNMADEGYEEKREML